MGMCVDLKTGEHVLAYRRGDETFTLKMILRAKDGHTAARIEIEAPHDIVLVPPNKQQR